MLKLEIIGHVGVDASIKDADGRRFATFRVAHSDTWTGSDGVRHEQTTWVDVTLPAESKVIPYLQKGTLVFIRGNISTRVYSSAKDKCMKAGISVRAEEIQLLGSRKDATEQTQETQNDAPFVG